MLLTYHCMIFFDSPGINFVAPLFSVHVPVYQYQFFFQDTRHYLHIPGENNETVTGNMNKIYFNNTKLLIILMHTLGLYMF